MERSNSDNPSALIARARNVKPSSRILWLLLWTDRKIADKTTDRLADMLGFAKPTIIASKKNLIEFNMISVEQINLYGNTVRHLIYANDPSEWVGVEFYEV